VSRILVHGNDPFCLHLASDPETVLEQQQQTTRENTSCRRNARFISPLLEYGYRPAVDDHESGKLAKKPLLLYLPGFDGTFLCPFLQFPELHTIFDVRCLTVATDDRSTLDELRDVVLEFIHHKCASSSTNRPVYLAGESFGGILTCEIANSIQDSKDGEYNLKGMMLINPATCFDRSILAEEGPKVAKLQPWIYPFGLAKLLPLFSDEYSVQQLFLILQSKALPSVIDNEVREAYMGRIALSLPFVVPYMAQETLKWRLNAWLEEGCARLAANNDAPLRNLRNLPTIIVAGENDKTLPSLNETKRLSTIWPDAAVHVVEGAGHASTCGSRVDLAALFRSRFPELQAPSARTQMKEVARKGKAEYFGMEPRYDNASIGLNPLKYWSSDYYRKHNIRM